MLWGFTRHFAQELFVLFLTETPRMIAEDVIYVFVSENPRTKRTGMNFNSSGDGVSDIRFLGMGASGWGNCFMFCFVYFVVFWMGGVLFFFLFWGEGGLV